MTQIGDFSVAFQSDFVGDKDHVVIKNAVVDTQSWFVIVGETIILPDVAHHTNAIANRPYTNMHHFVRGERVSMPLPGSTYGQLTDAVLIGGSNNYYHFNIDYLASAFSSPTAEELCSVFPVLTENRLSWQQGTLESLRLASNEAQDMPRLIKVDQLHLLRRAFDLWGQNLEAGYFDRIRERIEHLPPLGSEYKRVFISREKSPKRRIKDMASFIQRLDRRGFRSIVPDDISVSDQMRIFRSAEIVVAPHGAGLTNIIYAYPGTKIIELMPKGSWKPNCFAMIAKANGQMFNRILGEGTFEDEEFSVNESDVLDLLDI